MLKEQTYSRREVLKWGLATGGASAASPLFPGLLHAQKKDLLEEYFKKYGRVIVYDSTTQKVNGDYVEKYLPSAYLYKRASKTEYGRTL